MNRMMIDLKTLGTSVDACIISAAFVIFNEDEMFDLHYSIIDDKKGKIDLDTVRWWMKQSEEARIIFNVAKTTVDEFLNTVVSRYNYHKCEEVWSRGSTANRFGIFDFRHIRDTRTLFSLCKPSVERDGIAHNALVDAVYQVKQVQEVLSVLAKR